MKQKIWLELYLHVFGGQFESEGTQDVLKKVVA